VPVGADGTPPVPPESIEPPSSSGGAVVDGVVPGTEPGGALSGGVCAEIAPPPARPITATKPSAATHPGSSNRRTRPRVSRGHRHTGAMGFNPYRKYRATPLDFVLIVGVCAIAIGLLAWAFLG
jgi:hypothetical protein